MTVLWFIVITFGAFATAMLLSYIATVVFMHLRPPELPMNSVRQSDAAIETEREQEVAPEFKAMSTQIAELVERVKGLERESTREFDVPGMRTTNASQKTTVVDEEPA